MTIFKIQDVDTSGQKGQVNYLIQANSGRFPALIVDNRQRICFLASFEQFVFFFWILTYMYSRARRDLYKVSQKRIIELWSALARPIFNL